MFSGSLVLGYVFFEVFVFLGFQVFRVPGSGFRVFVFRDLGSGLQFSGFWYCRHQERSLREPNLKERHLIGSEPNVANKSWFTSRKGD